MPLRFFGLCSIPLFVALTLIANTQPNIIIILTDDMGYNDLGIQTYPSLTDFYPNSGPEPNFNTATPDSDWPQPNEARSLTPAIDSLGDDGLRMTRFYASPVCSPSRATMLTGRYQKRLGITRVFHPTTVNGQKGLNTEEVTLPELFRENGYATGMVGKWHLGYRPDEAIPFQMMPRRHGFEEFYGVPHSNDIDYFHLIEDETVLINSVKGAAEQAKLTWRYTERALDFIQRQTAEDRPFFLYLAHSQTHIPCYPSDQTFTNADGSTWPMFLGQSGVSNYYDVVMEADHSTQRILDKLDDLGIADDTIVIFTSDNGAWLISNADQELFSVGSNYPLRDGKQSTDEGGVRVPFLVRWPAQIPAGSVSDQVAGLQDLLPTLMNVAGGSVPADRVIDGMDLSSLWKGESASFSRVAAMFFYEFYTVIVKDNWKLGFNSLYNLDTDVQELTNLYDDSNYSGMRADLEAERDAIDDSIALASSVRGEFTDYEVELSVESVDVSEGNTASFDVRLSADPGANVTVDTAIFSGDSDLTVTGGSSHEFSSANWDQWQTVTVTAAQDADSLAGGATLRVSCSAISPVREVFVFEVDDDAPVPAAASLIWPKVNSLSTEDSTVKLIAEGSATIGASTDPAGSQYEWMKLSGPGAVSFSDPNAARTSIQLSLDGSYAIRLKVDHADSGGFGVADFVVTAGGAVSASELEYSPTMAYDASLDTNENSTWENLVDAGTRDWVLSSGLLQTSTDPAPNISFIDSAWIFPGGLSDGASSTTYDAFSAADASIEVWFQPDLPMSGKQVIWESGGDVGSSLTLDGDELVLAVDQSSGATVRAVIAPAVERDNFVHCVAVIDLSASEIRLFIDGSLEDSASIAGVTDWCGAGSASGVGNIYQTVSSVPVSTFNELGGNDQLAGSYEGFEGKVAILRFYDSALDADQITDLASGPDRTPVVSAGVDQSVAFTDGVDLDGTITINGLDAGASVSSVWRKYSGPGTVTFDDDLMADTSGAFSLPGDYTLWLEADDSEVKVMDDLEVAVAPLTYTEWKASFTFPIGQDGPDGNPDGYGLTTVWEWVLGYDPVVNDVSETQVGFSLADLGSVRRFQIQFEIPRDRLPQLTFLAGEDLPLDADVTALGSIVDEVISETMFQRTFTYEVPASDEKHFIRASAVE